MGAFLQPPRWRNLPVTERNHETRNHTAYCLTHHHHLDRERPAGNAARSAAGAGRCASRAAAARRRGRRVSAFSDARRCHQADTGAEQRRHRRAARQGRRTTGHPRRGGRLRSANPPCFFLSANGFSQRVGNRRSDQRQARTGSGRWHTWARRPHAVGRRTIHRRFLVVAAGKQQSVRAVESAVSVLAQRDLRAAAVARQDDRSRTPRDSARQGRGRSQRQPADTGADEPAGARRAGVLGSRIRGPQPGGADHRALAGAVAGGEQRAAGARGYAGAHRCRRSPDSGRQLPADRRALPAGLDRVREPAQEPHALEPRRPAVEAADRAL